MQKKSAVVIVAAGASRRMGRDKLWIPLAGRITLARTIDAFQQAEEIDAIVLVVHPQKHSTTIQLCQREQWNKVIAIIPGGERRQDSVCRGLEALEHAQAPSWVMIHDGARPFVTTEMIRDGLRVAQEHQAAIAAVPVKDTIKLVQDGLITETPDRSLLWAVQTPQVFAFDQILNAHHSTYAEQEATDDAQLMERCGHHVATFPGSYTNIKITTQEDIYFAEALLRDYPSGEETTTIPQELSLAQQERRG